MTNWLIRRFITNWQDPEAPDVRSQYGNLSGAVGIVLNTLLFVAKLAAGLVTNSISIVGDAFNNLSDTASSVIAVLSFRLSRKPADKEHPFGHARFEYFASTIVAVLILVVSFNLIQSSVNKILHPEAVSFSWLAIIILALSILLKLWLYIFNKKLADTIGSTLLRATSIDSLSDVLATSSILAATILSPLIDFSLDGYMGIVVAIFIGKSAVDILRDTADSILGEAPSREETKAVEEFVSSYEGILGTHDLIIHAYGPGRTFASIHAEMDADGGVLDTHGVIDRIERDMLEQHDIHLLIHLDPVVLDDPERDRVQLTVDRLIRTVDPMLTQHDLRVVDGEKGERQLIFEVTAPYDLELSDEEIVRRLERLIRNSELDYDCLISVDRAAH